MVEAVMGGWGEEDLKGLFARLASTEVFSGFPSGLQVDDRSIYLGSVNGGVG